MIIETPQSKDQLYINTSNYADKEGYSLKVVNTVGKTLFETLVTRKEYTVDIQQKFFGGQIYLEILDQDGNIMDVTKVR